MFSIITPTYNRAHTLDRVFSSLLKQTDQDFEWIIIDDASTDQTQEMVEMWQKKETSFTIDYYLLPENKGKPNALNVGLQYCSRPITIIADSDDSFVANTITELRQLWNTVNISENADKIATIWTLVDNENGQLVGEPFPHNFWQVNLNERVLERKKMVEGEKWHSWRTSVLKKHKMYHSEFAFVGEGATWNSINKAYDFLCVNIIHRTYFNSPDGLIQKKKSRIEIEKLKFYYAYYQLHETSIINIIKHRFYHQYAFEYLKSIFYYKKKDISLEKNKIFSIVLPAFIHLPYRIFIFYIKKK